MTIVFHRYCQNGISSNTAAKLASVHSFGQSDGGALKMSAGSLKAVLSMARKGKTNSSVSTQTST